MPLSHTLRTLLTAAALGSCQSRAVAQEVPFTTGTWNADSLGNHRAAVRVTRAASAVAVHIPWRRPDAAPEDKEIIIVDGALGQRVRNVARLEVSREFGDLVFEPTSGAGEYFVYYLPFVMSGSQYYPKVTYPAPTALADSAWLRQHGLDLPGVARAAADRLSRAEVVAIQAIDEFNSFYPMEVIATAQETEELLQTHPAAPFLLFPEDRRYPIRMSRDLPWRWIARGAEQPLRGTAARGEFYSFQIGVYGRVPLEALTVTATDFRSATGAAIPSAALSVFNLRGTDWTGAPFDIPVSVAAGSIQALWLGLDIPLGAEPGLYEARITVGAAGLDGRTVAVAIEVTPDAIARHGDDEPARLARLRWLDSRIALDDSVVAPYTPVTVDRDRVEVLGRRVTLDRCGLPRRIESFFAPTVTEMVTRPRELLAAPVALTAHATAGTALPWRCSGWQITHQAPGIVRWEGQHHAGTLTMRLEGELEFDGTMEFRVAVTAGERADLADIRLDIPVAADVARYMLGMGQRGGLRPDSLDWAWDWRHNQDGAWLGDVNAGLQFSLRDEHYERPLNTNFYLRKPLVIPTSWGNGGRGGCRLRAAGTAYRIICYSGPRTMDQGQTLRYDFRLVVTPFRMLDTDAQWRTRFYHRYRPLAEIAATGANTVNVHHATDVNPYINYPFLSVDTLRAYVAEGHRRGFKVKIYYTVRELTNRAPELFALRSLGHEILSDGPGGGPSWLQEHLRDQYIAGWYVPELKDAAVINSGVSRWHNFYLEGLDWLVRNVGIDGLYIDDVAFDRTVMKRVRKILDRGNPGALIDLHSANQFNERDGFANSANLYLEHFPYIDRLWFGEYFDYDAPPDYWLTEVSGIPFGLMGEMLEKGGNPWRGMLFGMTARLPWAGDPTGIWKAWDEFGMAGSRMIGFWVPTAPVRTGRDDILATSYVQQGRTLVALASWDPDSASVSLTVDWKALGLDPRRARLTAPAIAGFQQAARFAPGDPIAVVPGKGWLLILE